MLNGVLCLIFKCHRFIEKPFDEMLMLAPVAAARKKEIIKALNEPSVFLKKADLYLPEISSFLFSIVSSSSFLFLLTLRTSRQ